MTTKGEALAELCGITREPPTRHCEGKMVLFREGGYNLLGAGLPRRDDRRHANGHTRGRVERPRPDAGDPRPEALSLGAVTPASQRSPHDLMTASWLGASCSLSWILAGARTSYVPLRDQNTPSSRLRVHLKW